MNVRPPQYPAAVIFFQKICMIFSGFPVLSNETMVETLNPEV